MGNRPQVEIWTRNEAMVARLLIVLLITMVVFLLAVIAIGWQKYQYERRINQQLMGVGYSLRPVDEP